MISLSLGEIALIALILGPLSHVVVWIRRDIDSNSHQLLILANLIVILSPFVLFARGFTFLNALLYSAVSQSCYVVSLLLSIGIYRAFLHPLRRYPGPFWARVSVFWKVKQFSNSNYQPFEVIDQLHEQYGTVVRIGKSALRLSLRISH